MERTPEPDRTGARRNSGEQDDGAAAKPKPARLDLEKLDLSIEEVEERIRPGETNVFDK